MMRQQLIAGVRRQSGSSANSDVPPTGVCGSEHEHEDDHAEHDLHCQRCEP